MTLTLPTQVSTAETSWLISPLYLPYISPISPLYLEPGEHGGDQLAHDPRARQSAVRGGRRVARLRGSRGKARAELGVELELGEHADAESSV